jgi:hypothetical protein
MSKFTVKRYDLYWIEKQKFEVQELKRVVAEAGLEAKLIAFPKSQADFQEEAINWFEVRGIEVDTSEPSKKFKASPVTISPIGKEEITKPSLKKSKTKIPTMGIDED